MTDRPLWRAGMSCSYQVNANGGQSVVCDKDEPKLKALLLPQPEWLKESADCKKKLVPQ